MPRNQIPDDDDAAPLEDDANTRQGSTSTTVWVFCTVLLGVIGILFVFATIPTGSRLPAASPSTQSTVAVQVIATATAHSGASATPTTEVLATAVPATRGPTPQPAVPLATAVETRTPEPGAVLLEENFPTAAVGKLPKASADPSHYTLGYEGGEYVIKKSDAAWNRTPIVTLPGEYSDTSLSVNARVVGDSAGRFVAVGCRAQASASDSAYRFVVDPTQAVFTLSKWSGGNAAALVEWRHSDAIHQGNQGNSLGLTCTGPRIAASINGVAVASAEDSTYVTGALVLMGGAFDKVGTAEVRFAKLVVLQAAASGSAASIPQPTLPSRAATAMPTAARAVQTPAWERENGLDSRQCLTATVGNPYCEWLNARRRLLTDLDCNSFGRTVTYRPGDIVFVGSATLNNYGQALTDISMSNGAHCSVPSELVRLMDQRMGRGP